MEPARVRRKRGTPRTFSTVRERIAWSYANLARAHAALTGGRTSYTMLDHMIRAKLFAGLCAERMAIRTLFDNEKIKMHEEPHCVYCGARDGLVVDHLIPRKAGGADDGGNLVRACVSCNSSKRDADMLVWLLGRSMFPSVFLYRRYLKAVLAITDSAGLLDCAMDDERLLKLPFDVASLPANLPALADLRLSVA